MARSITLYYGASVSSEAEILGHGLRAQRTGGGVFVAVKPKAVRYAGAWGAGLHALGMGPPEGVVFALRLPKDTVGMETQIGEWRLVQDYIPAVRIKVCERIDLSGISPAARAGHLFNFLGIVAGSYPEGSRWEVLEQQVLPLIQAIPSEVISQGMRCVPAI